MADRVTLRYALTTLQRADVSIVVREVAEKTLVIALRFATRMTVAEWKCYFATTCGTFRFAHPWLKPWATSRALPKTETAIKFFCSL